MPWLDLHTHKAPIEYSDIRRKFQAVRIGGGAALVAIGVLGVIWGVSAAWFIVVAALGTVAHAVFRLVRPGERALTSILLDITLVGVVLLVIGEVPQAEAAALAYFVIASLLFLAVVEAALVIAYTALWAALIVTLAPVGDVTLLDSSQGATLDRIAGVAFLLVISVLLIGTSRVLRAISERQERAIEVERRASQMKNEFVSMVSHELRTPLTSIAGFIETLRESWRDLEPAEVDEFLAITHNEAVHLKDLVEDVLVIPRLEAGRLPLVRTNVDLRDIAENTVRTLLSRSASSRDADVAIPGGVIVRADPTRVQQVVRNLVENAMKYGGDQILIEGARNGGMYQVVVSDNGPGVPPEDRDRIFEHFEQVSKGDARTDSGIGLGLPIARKLVRAMDGELWYEPRFPTGSRFCFSIPLVTSPDLAPQETAPLAG